MSVLSSGNGLRKGMSVFTAAVMLAGVLAVLPFGTQNAMGYTTPGTGVTWTFDDLVAFSGGAVTGGMSMYQVHETITILPGDTLVVTAGLIVQMDPGLNIAIEVLGMLDGNTGSGTLFHSGGPGTWRGLWVHDSGTFMANGFTILDAQDGIYIDHSAGFGMVQIMGCDIHTSAGTGITMIGTMGGPMVGSNVITGCPTGISLKDTSAQCMNNDVSMCGIGIRVEGFASPLVSGSRIHDNSLHGICAENTTFSLNSNVIRENRGDAVAVLNSTIMMDNNDIWGWNATAGSAESGRDGVRINGSVEWGQNYITNNRIYGGRGDEAGSGGHAIHIEDFSGNPLNDPQIENTIIENNLILRGGDGGHNMDDWGYAGHGGHGVCVGSLPDEGDPASDNHAVRISGNSLVCGGRGGDDLSGAGGYAGHGGHGVCVDDDNNRGSMLASGNTLVTGGDGGGAMSPTGRCGGGGHGMCIEDCDSDVRLDVRNHGDVAGGACGPGMSVAEHGGAGIRLVRCDGFHITDLAGRSSWSVVEAEDCDGDWELRNIRISDSKANSGNLVRATGSSSTGNNENWDFEGRNGIDGVVIENCDRLALTGADIRTSNATGMVFHKSGNISLDDLEFNITDGNGIVMNWACNITVFNTSMEMWWTDIYKPDIGIYVNHSEEVNVAGLEMDWGAKDSPSSEYASAWKYSYDCDNSSYCTVFNGTLKGAKAKVRNCANVQFVESFFDVLYNLTGVNNTGADIFNSSATNFDGCGINVTNGNGLVVNSGPFLRLNLTSINVTCPGPSLSGNFAFKQTNTHTSEKKSLERCNISVTNADAVYLDHVDNFEIASCNILAVNGSGVSASNGTGVSVNDTGIQIPHLKYNGHGTFFKAIARGGCERTTVTVSGNGTGIEMWSSEWLYMKRIMVKATNATGIRLINSTNVGLERIDLDGTNSTDPERPCEGLESYRWDIGTLANSTVKGFRGDAVNLTQCNNISVFGNGIWDSKKTGIKLGGCSDIKIYHNNLINNGIQASDDTGQNSWDDGYPSGGNYWSDYLGPDLMSGPLQNMPGPDGIGDVPYMNIQGGTGAVDQYPLMAPWTPPPPVFFNVSLNIGWNLISIPLDLEITDITDVLASISGKYDSVKAYNTLDFMDPWKSYRQGGTENDLLAMDNTLGFWVHATEPCTLMASGHAPATTQIMLYAGWNLVGYPSLVPMPVQNALVGVIYDRVECFDPASPYIREMAPPEMMMPGAGYWIHVPADTVWIVDW